MLNANIMWDEVYKTTNKQCSGITIVSESLRKSQRSLQSMVTTKGSRW